MLTNVSRDDEVVIVDGQSTDGSGEFLRNLCRTEGFKFASTKPCVGKQRQLALKLAEGDYIIAHVDTDDLVVSLQEAKKLYHEAVEWDPITGKQRAFRCWGFFGFPREMIDEIGGYPDLHYYEDQLVAYRLAARSQLTQSWMISAVALGLDPKKRRLSFRLGYSYLRIREGLRLGIFEARNVQGFSLLPPAWLASLAMPHYTFRRDWWSLDVHRDEYILPWIEREGLSKRLLLGEIEAAKQQAPTPQPLSAAGGFLRSGITDDAQSERTRNGR